MSHLRFLTAGESHGKSLTVIIEGLPSNLPFNFELLNLRLAQRQEGYGRGGRMKIEKDTAEITSGVRNGKTLGSPLAIIIKNNDWENWSENMSEYPFEIQPEKITVPRPGHADMTGVQKYNFPDIRNSIERSSARETAARTAAGTVAEMLLNVFNIKLFSFVESIGGIYSDYEYYAKLLTSKNDPAITLLKELQLLADQSELKIPDSEQTSNIIEKIKNIKKAGDTLGGSVITAAVKIPPGLGSFVHFDRKLDAAIASSIMSVNAVKSVTIGGGDYGSTLTGSNFHDEIILENSRYLRRTNMAGGIEGGISTGMPILVRSIMKPISTLMMPLMSIDLKNNSEIEARRERSDFVAVPAYSVIARAALSFTLAQFFLDKFSGDSIEEIEDNFSNFNNKIFSRIQENFGG